MCVFFCVVLLLSSLISEMSYFLLVRHIVLLPLTTHCKCASVYSSCSFDWIIRSHVEQNESVGEINNKIQLRIGISMMVKVKQEKQKKKSRKKQGIIVKHLVYACSQHFYAFVFFCPFFYPIKITVGKSHKSLRHNQKKKNENKTERNRILLLDEFVPRLGSCSLQHIIIFGFDERIFSSQQNKSVAASIIFK